MLFVCVKAALVTWVSGHPHTQRSSCFGFASLCFSFTLTVSLFLSYLSRDRERHAPSLDPHPRIAYRARLSTPLHYSSSSISSASSLSSLSFYSFIFFFVFYFISSVLFFPFLDCFSSQDSSYTLTYTNANGKV